MTVHFTPRDRYILSLLCHGLEAKGIAAKLEVTVGTTHTHIRSLYRKAGVAGSHQLVLYVMQQPTSLQSGSLCTQGLHLPGLDSCPYCQAVRVA